MSNSASEWSHGGWATILRLEAHIASTQSRHRRLKGSLPLRQRTKAFRQIVVHNKLAVSDHQSYASPASQSTGHDPDDFRVVQLACHCCPTSLRRATRHFPSKWFLQFIDICPGKMFACDSSIQFRAGFSSKIDGIGSKVALQLLPSSRWSQ